MQTINFGGFEPVAWLLFNITDVDRNGTLSRAEVQMLTLMEDDAHGMPAMRDVT